MEAEAAVAVDVSETHDKDKNMIRYAKIQDFDNIMQMMINFANASPYAPLHDPQYDDGYIRNLLVNFMKDGAIIVGEKDGKLVGMLIALIQGDNWLPHVKSMRELAWWVEPEYRNSTIGYRLLEKYKHLGVSLQQKGAIQGFTLTNMETSPNFDLEKRGWRRLETNYVYEGV